MVIRSVRVFSLAKLLAVLYGSIGLVIGAVLALFSFFTAALTQMASEQGGALVGAFLGIGAVIAMPVIYGTLGFLVGCFLGLVFNFAASVIGGLEFDVSN